ncbi:MAG: N-acetylmuramoyl-L-alanine amidase [Coriobacteriia bacterium]|nr:N-acetylmuramoyl-L-alanine amidase [Coriobacteriia bacterium]
MIRSHRPIVLPCILVTAALALIAWTSTAHAAHIFIDPGHGSIITPGGGVDPGAVAEGLKEKDVALQISQRLATELRSRGHTVTMYRTGDVTTPPADRSAWKYTESTDTWAWQKDGVISKNDSLQERPDAANASGADIFISIHLNAYTEDIANGYETWAMPEDQLGIALATHVDRSVTAAVPLNDRGVKTSLPLYVIRWSHMPAILAECGFISNPADRAYVTSASGQATLARAIADGVDSFFATDPFRQMWPRISGSTRYGTAAALSGDGWSLGAKTVLLATGQNWPDALASAPLSRKLDAPLLLSSPTGLPSETAAELARLKPERIIVLGGTNAVPEHVVASAVAAAGSSAPSVERIAGLNRYETAAAIATAVGVPADGRVAIVGGSSPADAVSISAYAGKNLIPILLTEPGCLSPATETFRTENASSWRSTLIIGGTGAVSDTAVASLPARRRLAGSNRYATNTEVLEELHTSPCVYYVANGQAYSDCLAAGVRGAKSGGAVMLVPPRTIGDEQRLYIENHETRLQAIRMVGGTSVLPYLHEWMILKAQR